MARNMLGKKRKYKRDLNKIVGVLQDISFMITPKDKQLCTVTYANGKQEQMLTNQATSHIIKGNKPKIVSATGNEEFVGFRMLENLIESHNSADTKR